MSLSGSSSSSSFILLLPCSPLLPCSADRLDLAAQRPETLPLWLVLLSVTWHCLAKANGTCGLKVCFGMLGGVKSKVKQADRVFSEGQWEIPLMYLSLLWLSQNGVMWRPKVKFYSKFVWFFFNLFFYTLRGSCGGFKKKLTILWRLDNSSLEVDIGQLPPGHTWRLHGGSSVTGVDVTITKSAAGITGRQQLWLDDISARWPSVLSAMTARR